MPEYAPLKGKVPWVRLTKSYWAMCVKLLKSMLCFAKTKIRTFRTPTKKTSAVDLREAEHGGHLWSGELIQFLKKVTA